MTDWYAPNQQAVRADGSGPAEEGTGGVELLSVDTEVSDEDESPTPKKAAAKKT